MDKMENGLGEDGGECVIVVLWINLIYFRDRLIHKVFLFPVDDALSIYTQLSGEFAMKIL